MIVLVFEAVVCIALSIRGIDGFAYFLSNSRDVARITQKMWRVSLYFAGLPVPGVNISL